MTSAKLLSKYFWFLRAFMAGPITREELELRWLRSPFNNEHSRIPKNEYLDAMIRSAVDASAIRELLRNALTDQINDRELFTKGIDYSYYYEQND